jgi:hypothetical protein
MQFKQLLEVFRISRRILLNWAVDKKVNTLTQAQPLLNQSYPLVHEWLIHLLLGMADKAH